VTQTKIEDQVISCERCNLTRESWSSKQVEKILLNIEKDPSKRRQEIKVLQQRVIRLQTKIMMEQLAELWKTYERSTKENKKERRRRGEWGRKCNLCTLQR
jgi:hypothetical protein